MLMLVTSSCGCVHSCFLWWPVGLRCGICVSTGWGAARQAGCRAAVGCGASWWWCPQQVAAAQPAKPWGAGSAAATRAVQITVSMFKYEHPEALADSQPPAGPRLQLCMRTWTAARAAGGRMRCTTVVSSMQATACREKTGSQLGLAGGLDQSSAKAQL